MGQIGLGEIGSRMARIGNAFGMQVVAWSPHMTAERAAARQATALPLDELLATSKVVSLHLVPSAETRQLLDADRLASMRRDSLLVNTSRSALIDTAALAHALAGGRPAMAALDVYDEEPLPADHPLRRLPNVVLTPHLGFVAQPVFERFAAGVHAEIDPPAVTAPQGDAGAHGLPRPDRKPVRVRSEAVRPARSAAGSASATPCSSVLL